MSNKSSFIYCLSIENEKKYKIDTTNNINTVIEEHKKYSPLNYKIEFYLAVDNIKKNYKIIIDKLKLNKNKWCEIDLNIIKKEFDELKSNIENNVEKTGYVYCLSADKNNTIYKVGCTNSIKRRLAQHKTSSINTIELEFYFESKKYKEIEKKIHSLLKSNNIETLNNTEWFKCNREQILNLFKKESTNIIYIKESDLLIDLMQKSNNEIDLLREKINIINKNIFLKIDVIIWLENLLKIKRFDIENIKINELNNIKQLFKDNISKFLLLEQNNIKEFEIITNITNINSINLLQKFVAECYNKIYNFFEIANRTNIKPKFGMRKITKYNSKNDIFSFKLLNI